MNKQISDIAMEGAKITFRNFSGAPTKFNSRGGDRTFDVIFDDHELAKQLLEDGWNIKQFKPNPNMPDEEPNYHMTVTVRFDGPRPPRVELFTSHKRTRLDDETIGSLDSADIKNIDVIITPSVWEVNGKSGVKAYLKSAYVTINEDVFADKYADYE